MAYDEELAERVRELVERATEGPRATLSERKMFGGLSFLVNGNMAVAVSGRGGLLVRVGSDAVDQLLEREFVEPALMGGREMSGWLYVTPAGAARASVLREWVEHAVGYVCELSPKRKWPKSRRSQPD
ncbi:TfoX/Sxy family protein [Nocardia callitridis]|uniref:TfoX/Sxy family protein n=1 Tax=Nocardia callitridis TaxID=648753 RepID=A0ABP9JSD3_9NOCA